MEFETIEDVRKLIKSLEDQLTFKSDRTHQQYTVEINNVIWELQNDLHLHASMSAIALNYMRLCKHSIDKEIVSLMVLNEDIKAIKKYESRRREAKKIVEGSDLQLKYIESEILYTLKNNEYANCNSQLIAAESLKKRSGY